MKLKIDWEEVLTSLPPYINTHPKDLVKAMKEYHRQLEKVLESVLDAQKPVMAMEEPITSADEAKRESLKRALQSQMDEPETCTCEERRVLEKYKFLWCEEGNSWWIMRNSQEMAFFEPFCITNCPCCGKPLPMEE